MSVCGPKRGMAIIENKIIAVLVMFIPPTNGSLGLGKHSNKSASAGFLQFIIQVKERKGKKNYIDTVKSELAH